MLLYTFDFPKRTILPAKETTLKKRRLELDQFLRMLLIRMQSFSPDLFFESHNQQCLIMKELQTFLGLNDEVLYKFLRASKAGVPRQKLSLAGWYEHRRTIQAPVSQCN